MKYVKSGNFTTKQLSISETIIETSDVINIAKDIIQKLISEQNNKSQDLMLVLNNLNQATSYLKFIEDKTSIALNFVPADIQEKEFL